jgi:dihydroorotase
LDRPWTYNVKDSASKSRNTPFDGRSFKGGPVATIVAGKLVWKN